MNPEEGLLLHLKTALAPERVEVCLTRNRSVYLSTRRRGGALWVRASRVFLMGDTRVWDALASHCRRPSPSSRRALGQFFSSLPRERVSAVVRPLTRVRSKGRIHDLKEALERALNLGFPSGFEGALPKVGWSRQGVGRSVHRLGSYERGAHMVRIHPCLDDAEVPLDFVAHVIFHELLHAVHPTVMGRGGRWVIHSRAFKIAEAAYPHHAWAHRFEKRSLDRIISRQKKAART